MLTKDSETLVAAVDEYGAAVDECGINPKKLLGAAERKGSADDKNC